MADIELVIKIPEEMWERVKEGYVPLGISKHLRKGTPLPKNHGDFIDVNRKITVPIYDEQCEEWSEKTLTVLEALNRWSDEGVTVKDVVIPANKEAQE